ncbi:hypothetical protein K7X08_035259 [Anisodus acutangulus]|uniref:Uncharacterized protein n=1 Tax=Anisodus acutangulus TaxID=402998 RepID=A0A9Q1LKQ1_9SOLA|nr:hypothetical protein K7X08_035259 [Anisodus acutangulus]
MAQNNNMQRKILHTSSSSGKKRKKKKVFTPISFATGIFIDGRDQLLVRVVVSTALCFRGIVCEKLFCSLSKILIAQLGMGVVTVSSSASRSPLGLSTRVSAHLCPLKRPVIVSFKKVKTKNTTLVAPKESISLPIETSKGNEKRSRRVSKRSERVHAVSIEASPSALELDYSEAAAKLESIYKRSLETTIRNTEAKDHLVKRRPRTRKRIVEGDEEAKNEIADNVVERNQRD